MARGRDKHQAHQAAVAGLGRVLSRRAGNVCELTGEKTSLKVVEVAGGPDVPEEDWAVLVSPTAEALLSSKKLKENELRFLETAMWSEVRPVQIVAVRLLQRLRDQEVVWAREALEGLWLDPEVEGLI